MVIDDDSKQVFANRSPKIEAATNPLGRDLLQAFRYYLRGPWAWIALATAVIAAGVVLNWSWLVAVGVAPLLIAVLPCAAMCALGLCMSMGTGRGSTRSNEPFSRRSGVDPKDGRPTLRR
jgi:hypothetical protein